MKHFKHFFVLLTLFICGATIANAAVGDEVTSVSNIVSGTKYYIKGMKGTAAQYLSFTDNTGTSVTGTGVSETSSAQAVTFTLDDSSWYITTANGYYLTPATSNGKLILTTTKTSVTLSDGTNTIKIKGASYYLQKNKTANNFGGYNNTQNDVTLIVAEEASSVKSPTFSPVAASDGISEYTAASKSFHGKINVSLACETEGAAIYYTTNGDDPTSSSNAYSSTPIEITSTTTLKAIAYVGEEKSSITTAIYTQETTSTPTFNPSSATTFTGPGTLTATCEGATIYYTIGATTPADPTTTVYDGSGDSPLAITVPYSSYIKVIAVKDGYAPSTVATSKKMTVKCTAPTLTAEAYTATYSDAEYDDENKNFHGQIKVTLSGDDGCSFLYSTDGTTPSVTYDPTTGIMVSSTCTVKALATKDNCTNSTQGTQKYTQLKAATSITADVNAGTYYNDQTVTITSTGLVDGAGVYYTTDGEDPTTGSSVYSTPITINQACTLKASALKAGYESVTVSKAYTFQCYQPTTSATGDEYTESTKKFYGSVDVSLRCNTTGATIHYTTDGMEPTTESTLYTEPFTVTATTTVKAIAVRGNYNNSGVLSATYTRYFKTTTEYNTDRGSVTELAANIDEGSYDDFTVTPEDGFYIMSVTATNATVEQQGTEGQYEAQTWRVTPTGDCTIKVNFATQSTYTINWYANGTIHATTQVADGEGLVLPTGENPADLSDGKKFQGWYGSTYNDAATAPTYAKAGDAVTADACYYAVYAEVSEGEAETLELDYNDVPSSYGTSPFTKNEIEFSCTNVMAGQYSSNHFIQIKGGTSNGFYNKSTLGAITKIEVDMYNTAYPTIYVGTEEDPSDNSWTVSKDNTSNSYDISAGYKYVKVKGASSATQMNSITISYTPVTIINFTTGTETAPDYARAATAGNFGSICVDHNVASAKGAKFFEVHSMTKDVEGHADWISSISFSSIDADELIGGKGYLYRASADAVELWYTGDAVTEVVQNNGLVGNLSEKMAIGENCYYFTTDGGLKRSNGNATIGKNKAYIDPSRYEAASAKAIAFTIDFDDPTSIDEVNATLGDMFAGRNIFTLSGQKVTDIKKGEIYIVNGKKVMVK